MFGLVVQWDVPALAHVVSGGDVSVESERPHTLGVITDGCAGGGMTLCGTRFHGVMGAPSDDPREVPGVCVDCVAIFEAQRRHIVPAGWTREERDAYWRGFDHGSEYAAFMAKYPASEFGYTPMSEPSYLSALGREELRSRFDEGAEDGVRAFGMAGEWVTQW